MLVAACDEKSVNVFHAAFDIMHMRQNMSKGVAYFRQLLLCSYSASYVCAT